MATQEEVWTIAELQKLCFKNAEQHGWHNPPPSFGDMIALIHSEASEAYEEYRKGTPYSYIVNGKPEGIASEFADIIIRVCHYAEYLNIDLDAAIEEKMLYNKERPYRHGNKKA